MTQQTRAIKRTICIGLGGTGQDVLMRIRRFIIERYGKLSEMPIISFVQVDTDKGAFNHGGLPTGNTYHGENILFQESEKVVAKMNSQVVNDLVHELDHKTLFESPYSHIESWLDPRLKEQIKSIEDGAQGIRPIGRLAFFHNYLQFQEAVEAAENRTRGNENEQFMLKKGFYIQEGLDIFVVGSLCGGTGSGIFLDVAYSLRHLYQNKNNLDVIAYLVISPKLYGNTSTMNANTYAALKELNYYTNDESTFEACYSKHNQIYVKEQRPPFDFTYLVSEQTLGDHKISDKGKLCNLIAYKIFLAFSSELSGIIKSHRNNFIQPDILLGYDLHPFKMSQRYLTFGLSAIYFTRDRLVQMSLNRLGGKLINFWLQGIGQSSDARDLLDQFVLKWTADKRIKDYFRSQLQETAQDNNKTFKQALTRWRNSCQDLECKTSKDIEEYKENLRQKFQKEFYKVKPGEGEKVRGIWLTHLQNIQPNLLGKFKQDIDLFLEKLLSPNHSNFSLDNTLNFLEALRTQFNQEQRDMEERKQDFQEMYDLDKIEQAWLEIKQEIEDLQQKHSLPFFEKQKYSKIQEVMSHAAPKIAKLIEHNFQMAVNEESLKIIEELQQHLTLRFNQIQTFKKLLDNLQIAYQKQEEELKQLNLDEMNGEAMFPEDSINDCIPDHGSSKQLVFVSHQVTEAIGVGQSLFSLVTRNLIDEQELKSKTNMTVERQFGSVGMTQVQSAIKRFMETYAIADRSKRLEQILQSSEPLLHLNLSNAHFKDDAKKRNLFIGFKQTNEPEVKQFKQTLTEDIGISENSFTAIQAEDEIVILKQYAGFPLRIITGLSQLRNHYKTHLQNTVLHNDYNIMFTDIIPIEAKVIEELEYVFYPCLACKEIKYNSELQKYELPFQDALFNQQHIIPLSLNWREALEQIASRKDLTDIIHNIYNKLVAQIKINSPSWKTYYLPLILNFSAIAKNFSEKDVNFSYKAKVVGEVATATETAKEGIISRFIAKINEEIKSKSLPPNLHTSSGQFLPTSKNHQQSLPKSKAIIEPSIEDDAQVVEPILEVENNGMSELKELMDGYREGLLSKEEFEVAKKNLLGL